MIQNIDVPEIKGDNPKEQIKQIIDYLNDLSEKLTFILGNIDTDNLSPNLTGKINSGQKVTTVQTQQKSNTVDLSNYYTKAQVDSAISSALSDYVDWGSYNSQIEALNYSDRLWLYTFLGNDIELKYPPN